MNEMEKSKNTFSNKLNKKMQHSSRSKDKVNTHTSSSDTENHQVQGVNLALVVDERQTNKSKQNIKASKQQT